MNYIKTIFLTFLLISIPLAHADNEAWCLDTYRKHYNSSKKAMIATGAITLLSTVAVSAGPFGIIPIAIAGGALVTASYYKNQYEKAYFLIGESDPKYQGKYKYVLRVAKSAKQSPGKVSQIVWKNERYFCNGKTPWTYRKIRKSIKKRKLNL
jgi:hypothetical protein